MTAHPCTLARHEITRTWPEPKQGRVEAVCICWTCTEQIKAGAEHRLKSWVEVYRVERVEE